MCDKDKRDVADNGAGTRTRTRTGISPPAQSRLLSPLSQTSILPCKTLIDIASYEDCCLTDLVRSTSNARPCKPAHRLPMFGRPSKLDNRQLESIIAFHPPSNDIPRTCPP